MSISFSVLNKNEEVDAIVIDFMSEERAEEYNKVDIHGKEGTIFTEYDEYGNTTIWVGTGSVNLVEETKRSSKIISGINKAVAKCIELERDVVVVKIDYNNKAEEFTQEFMNSTYNFDEYKTEKPFYISEMLFSYSDEIDNSDKIVSLCEKEFLSIAYTRDLQNKNASEVTPTFLASEAHKLSELSEKVTITDIYSDRLRELNLGMLEAVGQASTTPPRLIVIDYKGDVDNDKSIVIVGKGVTYDSGGLSLKPSNSMDGMKMDMSGAAIVLGVIKYVISTEPKINVSVVIPTAENAIGSKAYRVGDVISGYSGKTVEVKNTDAEGRLILADAISYSVDKLNPSVIIDVATLTGAVLGALGNDIAGVFTNDNGKQQLSALKHASELSGEDIWELPLNDAIRDGMKSNIADISNISKIKGRHGASSAAAFLEAFVGDTPWIHIDVAGTAMSDKVGGTGWGVKLLTEYIYSEL